MPALILKEFVKKTRIINAGIINFREGVTVNASGFSSGSAECE